jgi:hypothetical protein
MKIYFIIYSMMLIQCCNYYFSFSITLTKVYIVYLDPLYFTMERVYLYLFSNIE